MKCALRIFAAASIVLCLSTGESWAFGYNLGAFWRRASTAAAPTAGWNTLPTSGAPPVARAYAEFVWTGSEAILWGGATYSGGVYTNQNTGYRYNPTTNSWSATTTTGAPAARRSHLTVAMGTKVLVFGGYDGSTTINTGGVYDPSTDSWTATSTTNAASARYSTSGVWTGSEVVIWGGNSTLTPAIIGTGARYNPTTNTWTAMTTTGAPAARGAITNAMVWTGTEVMFYGGNSASNVEMASGGRYNPSTDSWTAMSTTGAPSARYHTVAVWTGTEMVTWGGLANGYVTFGSGGRYNPTTNAWSTVSGTNAPAARGVHTGAWTGNGMIVFGGQDANNNLVSGNHIYNPTSDTWSALSTTNQPAPRVYHASVWTGQDFVVWGGVVPSPVSMFSDGARYRFAMGPPAQVAFTASPTTAYLGGSFDVIPIVQVQDSGGGPASSGAATITIAAFSDSLCSTAAPGTLTGSSASGTAGSATFSSLSYSGSLASIYLKASASGLTDSACVGPITPTAYLGATSTNGNGNSVSLATPSGVAANHVLVAAVTVRGSGTTITAPAGWTQLHLTASASALSQAVYVRVATAGEPSSHAFTLGANVKWAAAIIAYSGIDPVAPVETSGWNFGAASTSIVAPDVTTAQSSAILVGVYGVAHSGVSGAPAGFTSRATDASSGNPGASNAALMVAEKKITSNGATGTSTATAAGSAENIGHSILLKLQ